MYGSPVAQRDAVLLCGPVQAAEVAMPAEGVNDGDRRWHVDPPTRKRHSSVLAHKALEELALGARRAVVECDLYFGVADAGIRADGDDWKKGVRSGGKDADGFIEGSVR